MRSGAFVLQGGRYGKDKKRQDRRRAANRRTVGLPAVLLVCMVVLCAVVLTLCVLYRPEKVENQGAADAEEKTEEQDAAGSQTEEERIRQAAQEILTRMTVEEKVGQLFIARCPE